MTRILFRLWLWIIPSVFLLVMLAIVVGQSMPRYVLVFVHRHPIQDMFIYDLTRDVEANLTHDPPLEFMPLWSPDYQKIVFMSDDGSGYLRLAVIDVDGQNRHWLAEGNYGGVRWLPDGSGLLAVKSNARNALDLYVLGLDGSATPADINQPEMQRYIDEISVSEYPSPDGERAVYYDECGAQWCVFVREGDTTTPIYTFLDTEEPRFREEIVWSPDGRYLAFTVIYTTQNGLWNIYVIDSHDTQKRVALIPNAFAPNW